MLRILVCLIAVLGCNGAWAAISTGADGLFHPDTSTSIDVSAQKVFNFTQFIVDPGITVTLTGAVAGDTVSIFAASDLTIGGTLDLRPASQLVLDATTISMTGSVFVGDSPAGNALSVRGATIGSASGCLSVGGFNCEPVVGFNGVLVPGTGQVTGGQIVLTETPEPSSIAALAAGLALLGWWASRSRPARLIRT